MWSVLRVAAFVAAFVVGVFAQMVFQGSTRGCPTNKQQSVYIQSDHDRIFGPFPSRIMNDKHDAVVKYLERNMKTKEQVVDLFEKFSGADTAAGKT
jgi:hypothetical protein